MKSAYLRQVVRILLVTAIVMAAMTAFTIGGRAEVPMVVENFDSFAPPDISGGWAVEVVNGTGCSWATNAGTVQPAGYAAHSAPNLAYFNASACAAGASARLYRTAGVNLSAFRMARVSFWLFRDTGKPGSEDSVQVQVSVDGGSTWQSAGKVFTRPRSGTSKWQRYTVDLTAYTGVGMNNVRIAFLGVSANGN
ncbi:MAG: choice-of-anchor J domain-containing protein, partial [Anaerolineae bacterium]